jgi:hypothetical protein
MDAGRTHRGCRLDWHRRRSCTRLGSRSGREGQRAGRGTRGRGRRGTRRRSSSSRRVLSPLGGCIRPRETLQEEFRHETLSLSKSHARTVVIVEIPTALQRPFCHRRGRHTLHLGLSVCGVLQAENGVEERTVPDWGSHSSPPLHPPSMQALGPMTVEEKLQSRRP